VEHFQQVNALKLTFMGIYITEQKKAGYDTLLKKNIIKEQNNMCRTKERRQQNEC
jgi:hypothetical protein